MSTRKTTFTVGGLGSYSEARISDEWVLPFDFREGVRIRTAEKFADHYDLFEELGEWVGAWGLV